jgi:hypothetical protein
MKDIYDDLKEHMDFRFGGAGIYGDHFYNQFYLDEKCQFHKDNGPAIVDCDGNKVWFRHGERWREGDLPAYEGKNGDKAWYKDGQLHRDGKPAIEYADGRAEWWLEGCKLSDAETATYKALLREQFRQAGDKVTAAEPSQNPTTPAKPPKLSK